MVAMTKNEEDKPVESHSYVEFHPGGAYEGWGDLDAGWYVRRTSGECGGCAQCTPAGPFDDEVAAVEEMKQS